MNDFVRIIKKLLFLPIWLIILLTLFSAASLTLVFVKGLDTHPMAYAVYVIAFYTLSVLTAFFSVVFPKHYRAIKSRVYENKYGNRYLTDAVFRTHVSLYRSLAVNMLYVITNAVSGYVYSSAWFVILAGYYAILATMRFILLRFVSHNELGENLLGEWKRARVCACILTLINLALSGAILMMMYQSRGYEYHGILIYVMAAYTFYITTHAIINIIKYRRMTSPVMSTAKSISLAAALVSMLNLETAMFSAFGAEMTVSDQRIMIAATGAGISIVIIAMSSYLIMRSAKEITKLKEKAHNV